MGRFSVNAVVFGGFLAADPETKDLPSGDTMTRFRLALSNGEDDAPMYLAVATFGKQAEACAQYLTQGCLAVVEGRLHQSQWNSSNGEKKTATEVRAHRVTFLPKGSQNKEAHG